MGDLAGFFECVANKSVRISILSQDDVENIYKLTYLQGESITVHMGDRDMVFRKNNKQYVADFLDWV